MSYVNHLTSYYECGILFKLLTHWTILTQWKVAQTGCQQLRYSRCDYKEVDVGIAATKLLRSNCRIWKELVSESSESTKCPL